MVCVQLQDKFLMFGILTTLHKSCDERNVHNVSMNIKQTVVGVFSCVVLYLTPQSLHGREIYWQINETSGENIITEQKIFHFMFQLFTDRFRHCLGFELLNKV